MYKIGVIGRRESVMYYAATGFKPYVAENAETALIGLKSMADDAFAIVFITEEYAEQLSEEIKKYRDKPDLAVIVIPGAFEKSGYGMRLLKNACEKAVGINILK
jgi:V/A-type H+-transporting ATPase subunit F